MTVLSYELGSHAKLMTAIKDFLSSIGVPIGMLTPLAWLWSQGHWSMLLLAAALLFGAHVYWLGKRLPWHQGRFSELSELNAQKNLTYASLQRRLARAGQALPLVSAAALKHNPSTNSWHVSLGSAEAWFSRHLGAQVWSYAGFNKLLLFALAYPMVFLLLTWLITDVGQMGQATVLPSYGAGCFGFFKRMGVCALIMLPWLSFILVRRIRPGWVLPEASTKDFFKVVFLFVVAWFISTRALQFAGAFADAGVLVIAGSLVLALVLALARALALAHAGVGALVLAGTLALALALSGVGGFAAAVTFAGVGSGAMFLIDFNLNKHPLKSPRWDGLFVLILTFCLAGAVSAVTYFVPLWVSDASSLAASKKSFTVLLFLDILPLCNALFDWVSLGATRLCLRQIAAGRYGAVVLVVLDIILGLLLTAGLFAIVLKILQWMQAAGWGIDAQAMVATFRANPLDPQVSWIAMLALTNMLPTLIHLVISFWGLVSRQIRMPREHVGAQVHSLLGLLDANGRFVGQAVAAPQASPILGVNGQAFAAKLAPAPSYQPISTADLNALFNYLYVDHWLVLLTVLGVVVALWSQYLTVLAWFLGLLV
jgi:hypothetical protein